MERLKIIVTAALLAAVLPTTTAAQERVGGHFGIFIPLAVRANGTTSTVNDDFTIGFPTGITVRTTDRIAFDFEFLPIIQNEPLHVDLTVHPGVIVDVGNRIGAGVRMAFDVNRASWGFTPLVKRGFRVGGETALFGEVAVPIRFQIAPSGSAFKSVGLGVHVGIAF